MAYTYKQIGTSAAVVATTLAFGALLWWQRPPAPVEIPRPQDEAEIMTTALERNFAIGKTATNFGYSYASEVSIIITGNSYTASVMPTSSLSTQGLYYINETIFNKKCGWTQGKIYPFVGSSFVITNEMAGGQNVTVTRSISRWSAVLGVAGGWKSTTNNLPAVLNPTYSYCKGVLSIQAGENIQSNLYQTITNTPTHTVTNTIGMFPNATIKYPDSIRSAITPKYAGWSWLVPSNIVLAGSDWDISASGNDMPERLMHTDANWWTNSVTLTTGILHSTTNYSYTNIVFTNSAWATNVMHSTTNYAYSFLTNTWENRIFAFERDNKKYYWSTNAYNDMSRALSLMQWQIDTGVNCSYGPSYDIRFNYTVGRQFPWQPVTTNIGEAVTNIGAMSSFITNNGAWFLGSCVAKGENYREAEIWIYYLLNTVHITNTTSFAWTNGVVWVPVYTNSIHTNSVNNVSPAFSYFSQCYADTSATTAAYKRTRITFSPVNIPAHGSTNIFIGSNLEEANHLIFDHGKDWVQSEWNWLAAQGSNPLIECWYYPDNQWSEKYPEWGNTNPPSLLYGGILTFETSGLVPPSQGGPAHAYKVQFSALTNYLNHAPAR